MNNTNNSEYGFRFPIDIFPDEVQTIINHYNDIMTIQKSYLGAGFLYSVSVACGVKYKSTFSGFDVIPSIWFALVGDVSMKKTPAISQMIKPIIEIDRENFKIYQMQLKEFKKSKSRKEDNDDIEEPIYNKMLVNDFTTESLVKTLYHNKNGLGVYSDELKQWINNFNRYSKGSDKQFWLSIFSNGLIENDRKGSETLRIENPFVSVIGGIQRNILSSLSGFDEDGFIQRLLFVLNETDERGLWNTEKEIDEEINKRFTEVIRNIYLNNGMYKFSNDTKQVLVKWQKNLKSNYFNIDYSYLGKFEIYVLRFSLLLQIISDYYSKSDEKIITLDSVNNAIRLINYFAGTITYCNKLLNGETPKGIADQKTMNWYESLEEKVLTSDAVINGEMYNISESKVKRLLKNTELFEKIGHGEYSKVVGNQKTDEEIVIPDELNYFKESLEMYINDRNERKKTLTRAGLKAIFNKLIIARESYSDEYINERIENSIIGGYPDIYLEDKY